MSHFTAHTFAMAQGVPGSGAPAETGGRPLRGLHGLSRLKKKSDLGVQSAKRKRSVCMARLKTSGCRLTARRYYWRCRTCKLV